MSKTLKAKGIDEAIQNCINSFFSDQTAKDVNKMYITMYERFIAARPDISQDEKSDFLLYINNVNRLLYALESISEPFI